MKSKQILTIAIIISMICFGCEKDSDTPSADLSVNAVGLYSGTWVVVGLGQVSGTCQVNKVSSTSVNLIITAGGQTMPTSPDVSLSDGGGGKIMLTASDSECTTNGNVINKTLSLTLKCGAITETFTGTKP
ncbi:MAG: hypothetical protein Q7U54_01255 [Bacteroidales bacterium]|nr:hypothetical protein [Bacteroidales bacterium]